MSDNENPKGKVVAKALADEAFKQQLTADPTTGLTGSSVTLAGASA